VRIRGDQPLSQTEILRTVIDVMQLSLKASLARPGATAQSECAFCDLERELFRNFTLELKGTTLVPIVDRATLVRVGLVRGATASAIAAATPKTGRGRKAQKSAPSAPSKRGRYLIDQTGQVAQQVFSLRGDRLDDVLARLCPEHQTALLKRRQAIERARDASKGRPRKPVSHAESDEAPDSIKQHDAAYKQWKDAARDDSDELEWMVEQLLKGARKMAGDDSDLAARALAEASARIKSQT